MSAPRRHRPGLRHALAAAAWLAASPWVAAQTLPSLPGAGDVVTPGDASSDLRPPGPAPRVFIERRVFANLTYSDNYLLSDTNRQSEWVTELGAGVRAALNLPRLRGNVDYSLSGLHYANGLANDGRRQVLDSQLLLDAGNGIAFVEFDGNIENRSVSAFGAQTIDTANPANRAETRRFSVSPFVRGEFNGALDYELRYNLQSQRTDEISRSDIDERGWSASLTSSTGARPLGWQLTASSNEVDYAAGRETRFDTVGALLRYAIDPTLEVFGQVGRENNDLLTVQRESYDTRTAGFDWRPVQLARLAASVSKRFFGDGHSVTAEYRFRRVLLRFNDVRDVVTTQATQGTAAGTLGSLLDALYLGIETDPVRRAALVSAELQRLGLPGELTTLPAFLTSSVTLQRNQDASVSLLGERSVVSFSLDRRSSRRLGTGVSAIDDFDLSSDIRQKGWSLSYAHRLSPRLSASAVYQRYQTEGQTNTLGNRLSAVTLGLSARLARRTTGALYLRRAEFDSSSPYRETAIQASLVHRF